MDNNENMVNEEIMEATTKGGFKKFLVVGGIVTGIVLAGFGLVKGGKLIARKIKEKREADSAEEIQED
jgi:hypothetical protein